MSEKIGKFFEDGAVWKRVGIGAAIIAPLLVFGGAMTADYMRTQEQITRNAELRAESLANLERAIELRRELGPLLHEVTSGLSSSPELQRHSGSRLPYMAGRQGAIYAQRGEDGNMVIRMDGNLDSTRPVYVMDVGERNQVTMQLAAPLMDNRNVSFVNDRGEMEVVRLSEFNRYISHKRANQEEAPSVPGMR